MFDNNKVLIIADIEPFIFNTINSVNLVGKNYNLQDEELDYFFDWAINQILEDSFEMKVIHHYRHDIYKCIYSELAFNLNESFARSVNIYDLRTLKRQNVKTLVNGRDLFITRRSPYKTNYV